MVQGPALISPAAEVAASFLDTAREQLRAAQAAEWSTVDALADFRALLLERLAGVTAGPLSAVELETLVHAITETQNLDVEIARRAEHERRRLKDELDANDRGRRVAGGYHWASPTTNASLVDRYG